MGARALGAVPVMILSLMTSVPRVDAAPIQLSSCQTLLTEGAYVVTQNLFGASPCLVLAADRITIDLSGFIVGEIASAGNATRHYTVIRNGAGDVNLPTSKATVLERVRASAILVGSESLVKDCVVVDSGGISVGPRSLVVGNIASDAGGLSVGGGSTVKDNVVSQNTGDGVVAGPGSTVSGNVAVGNDGRGLFVQCPSAVVGNSAPGNGGGDIVLSGKGCARSHNVPKP